LTATDTHTRREELLEMQFSTGSAPRLYRVNKLDNLFSQKFEGVGALRSCEGVASHQGQELLETEVKICIGGNHNLATAKINVL
jgi:hypothetical protein